MSLNKKNHELKSELLAGNINIKVVMNVLIATDIRTAISWCKRNGVFIFKIGKEKYVNAIEFELGIDKPFIESLKIKHPKNWKEVYCAFKNEDFFTILDKDFQKVTANQKFEAPGKSGNNFIKNITSKKD